MRGREYLVATRSAGKIREITNLLCPDANLRIVTPEEIGIAPAPEEDEIEVFTTFRQNASAKATYFARLTGLPTIADDSGIAVDVLGGAPGVHSKRFAGQVGHEGHDLDQANNRLLLERLRGVPTERRTAHYACAATLATPDRVVFTSIGTCSGIIATEPRGTGGFGYDPIFLLPELDRTFAEISPQQKNELSHRARAFHALRAHLEFFLDTR